jgi:hypothetical protein
LTEPTAAPAAPAPSPAPHAAPAPAPRKVMALRPQKSFPGATATDRMKDYLKDVPVLHARLSKVVVDQEANLAAAKKALVEFDAVTAKIKAVVAKWEEEQSHGRTGHDVPAAPAHAREAADPAAGASAAGPGEPGTAGDVGKSNAC